MSGAAVQMGDHVLEASEDGGTITIDYLPTTFTSSASSTATFAGQMKDQDPMLVQDAREPQYSIL